MTQWLPDVDPVPPPRPTREKRRTAARSGDVATATATALEPAPFITDARVPVAEPDPAPVAPPEPTPVAPPERAPADAPESAPSAPARPQPHHLHRRAAAAVALLGLVLLVLLLTFALGSSPSETPPATAAAELVPADALLYIHLSTDPSRPAVKRAAAVLARLPDHGAAITGLSQRMVAEVGGSPSTSFSRDIRPWLGNEAAFALLNTTGASAGSVIVLQVADLGRARAFIARAGAQPAGTYARTPLYTYGTGAELAFVRGSLVVGQDAGVRAVIDAGAGRIHPLASSATYRRAAATEPAARVLDAYVSAGGVSRVLDAQPGLLGLLGTVLDQPGLQASAISVTATPSGLAVQIHDVLDPKAAARDHTRLQPFTPTLENVLPSGSALMLDARNLADVGPTALRAIGRIGLLRTVPDLLRHIGSALTLEGYNVHGLLSLFSGETAIALAAGSGAPALVIVTRTTHEASARVTLASLEPPLAQLFAAPGTGSGIEPEFGDVQVGGVTAHEIRLAPGLQLDFAVFRGLIVVSTSLRGIGDVAARSRDLGSDAAYRAVLRNAPPRVTSLGFADFSQLLSYAEQSSLARSSTFRDLQVDLQKIRAVGMDSTSGEADTTAEAFFQIP